MANDPDPPHEVGAPEDVASIPAAELSDGDLLTQLGSLHRSRHEALRHAPTRALRTHLTRTAELETEYLRRFPSREVDPGRLR